MRKTFTKTSEEASITVYLTLILLIILSLFFTIIEGARVGTAKVYAERALSTAMDSVLADYYGPLWEEYHIFGYNAEGKGVNEKEQQIEEKLAQYMSYTFEPNGNQKQELNQEGMELYDISIDAISVVKKPSLIDYQGELLINEAVEYMKYEEIADGLELLLDKMSILETPKKVTAVYEDKIAAEEELVKMDQAILELMELLDGVRTTQKGIDLDNEGKLQTKDYFVKKICFEEVTMDSVNINNEAVFHALKDEYVNPLDSIDQIKKSAVQLDQIKQRRNEIREMLKNNADAIKSAQEQLQQVSSGDTKSEEVKEQIANIEESIQNLLANRTGLQKEEVELKSLKQEVTSSVNSSMNNLLQLFQELKPLLEDAISAADDMIGTANSVEYLIDDFEETLNQEKDGLGKEILNNLEKSLGEMREYTSSCREGEGVYDMMDVLSYNLLQLNDTVLLIEQGQSFLSMEDYSSFLYTLDLAADDLIQYDISSIGLDYSSMILHNTKQKNPIKEIGNLLQLGLTSLVIDPSTISNKELTQEQLPSIEAALLKENTDFVAMITDFFENSIAGSSNSGIQSLMYGFGDTAQFKTGMEDGIKKFAEHLIYQEYIKEHFDMYPSDGEVTNKGKPSVLTYEQEYLLVGKLTDQENIASMIGRIVFLRMILDFVTILGDPAKCQEAKLAAAAMVGFTGLPILISITQTLLLLVWSFAEALVDTCALMMGKEVPILKTQLALQFPEMFLLNRIFLQSKASQMIETKQLAFSYQDYLRIFLLMKSKEKVAYLTMDLIQENINLRYEELFQMKNCLYGFEAEADFIVDTKFIAIPFVSKYINNDVSGFKFTRKVVHSY